MDENKLFELVSDDNFIKEILDCSSRNEIRQLFETKGKTISEEELDYLVATIEKALQTANTVCSDQSMDIVAGGTSFDALEDSLTRKLLFRSQKMDFDLI